LAQEGEFASKTDVEISQNRKNKDISHFSTCSFAIAPLAIILPPRNIFHYNNIHIYIHS
jgi:hypothetical protein